MCTRWAVQNIYLDWAYPNQIYRVPIKMNQSSRKWVEITWVMVWLGVWKGSGERVGPRLVRDTHRWQTTRRCGDGLQCPSGGWSQLHQTAPRKAPLARCHEAPSRVEKLSINYIVYDGTNIVKGHRVPSPRVSSVSPARFFLYSLWSITSMNHMLSSWSTRTEWAQQKQQPFKTCILWGDTFHIPWCVHVRVIVTFCKNRVDRLIPWEDFRTCPDHHHYQRAYQQKGSGCRTYRLGHLKLVRWQGIVHGMDI